MFFLAIVREQIKRVTYYTAEILPMLRKTLSNQSINQLKDFDHFLNQGSYSYRILFSEKCFMKNGVIPYGFYRNWKVLA